MHTLGTTTGPVDLDAITETLHTRYPAVPVEDLQEEVSETARSFRDATVLDYLGVLIERAVRSRLRARTLVV